MDRIEASKLFVTLSPDPSDPPNEFQGVRTSPTMVGAVPEGVIEGPGLRVPRVTF